MSDIEKNNQKNTVTVLMSCARTAWLFPIISTVRQQTTLVWDW